MNNNNLFIINAYQLALFVFPKTKKGRRVGQKVAEYITANSIHFVLNHNEENNLGMSPERCLLAAVLVNAIKDIVPRFLQNGETIRNDRYSATDAYLWFKSKKQTPFSFLWICEQLGIDADTIKDNACRCYEQRKAFEQSQEA